MVQCPNCGRKFYLVEPNAATDDPGPVTIMVPEAQKGAADEA